MPIATIIEYIKEIVLEKMEDYQDYKLGEKLYYESLNQEKISFQDYLKERGIDYDTL